jgi:hypothetical protein
VKRVQTDDVRPVYRGARRGDSGTG